VDGSVRRIDTAYDSQGNAYLITSYNAVSGGSIVNQIERTFNGLGQLTAEYQSHSGAVNTSTSPSVQYAYSEMSGGVDNSRLTSITYPDGYVLTFNYSTGLNNTISRLSSLSDSTGTLESYKYLGLDTVVERDHPLTNVNQTLITGGTGDAGDQYVGLDRFGSVVDDLWTSTSTTTDEFKYALDLVGNRTAITNVVDSSFNQSFTYDNLDQLLTFTQGTHTQNFNYDAVGNATSVTTDGTTQTRSANAQNQYTSISGATTPTYDANGNMTTDETGRQFVYDAWNRLVAVKNSSGTTLETFSYDGLGRRITQTASGTTTDLYYSTQDQVLEEMVGGSATARYVWSPVYVDALVLRDRATGSPGTLNERLWVQQDANWNVTALVNGSGVVVERYVYDPYGKVTIYSPDYSTVRTSSSYAWTQGFQGMFYDATSGLDLSRNRPGYSPTLERWTSVDPIGLAPDVNDYRFVGNNPTDGTDPSGLFLPAAAAPVVAVAPYVLGAFVVCYVGYELYNAASHAHPITFPELPPKPAGSVAPGFGGPVGDPYVPYVAPWVPAPSPAPSSYNIDARLKRDAMWGQREDWLRWGKYGYNISPYNYTLPPSNWVTVPGPTPITNSTGAPDPTPAPQSTPAPDPVPDSVPMGPPRPRPNRSHPAWQDYQSDWNGCVAWAEDQMRVSFRARELRQALAATSDTDTQIQIKNLLGNIYLGYINECMRRKGWEANTTSQIPL